MTFKIHPLNKLIENIAKWLQVPDKCYRITAVCQHRQLTLPHDFCLLDLKFSRLCGFWYLRGLSTTFEMTGKCYHE